MLKEKLGVNCLVGLTATATRRTAVTVAKHLGIGAKDAKDAVLFTSAVPANLVLSVSRVTEVTLNLSYDLLKIGPWRSYRELYLSSPYPPLPLPYLYTTFHC